MSTEFELDDRGYLSARAVEQLHKRYQTRLAADAMKLARRGLKARYADEHEGEGKPRQPSNAEAGKLVPGVMAYLTACHKVWRIPDDSAVVSAVRDNRVDGLTRDVTDPMPKTERLKYMGWLTEPEPEKTSWQKGVERVRNFLLRRKPDLGPMQRDGTPYWEGQSWFMARKDVPPAFKPDEARVYLPLDPDFTSPEQAEIVGRLEEEGYSNIDYVGGYATDDRKNRVKLGKVLKKLDDRLYDLFQRDGTRAADKNVLVLSRHPEDIARCSTGRAWSSCMDANKDWNFDPYVLADIRCGTVVAYLAKDSDPELKDPLARMLIKPMSSEQGQTIWVPEGIAYGLDSPVFRHTVNKLIDTAFNAGKSGKFELADGLYPDSISRTSWRFDQGEGRIGGKEALELLDIEYEEQEDGTLIVRQDIDLMRRGLTGLPDLSNVVLHGNLFLTGNRLTSLDGCPKRIHGRLDASGNQLTTLKGAPESVESLQVNNNQLTSFKGGPRKVRDNLSAEDNRLTSLEGWPAEFGFKGRNARPSISLNRNRLTSLEGMVVQEPVSLSVGTNRLTDLRGIPSEVLTLSAENNRLTSVNGLTRGAMKRLTLRNNPLTDLSAMPREIVDGLDLAHTDISSLGPSLKCVSGALNVAECKKLGSFGVQLDGKLERFQADNAGLTTLAGLPETEFAYAKGVSLRDLQGVDKITDELVIDGMKIEARELKNPAILKAIAQPAPIAVKEAKAEPKTAAPGA